MYFPIIINEVALAFVLVIFLVPALQESNGNIVFDRLWLRPRAVQFQISKFVEFTVAMLASLYKTKNYCAVPRREPKFHAHGVRTYMNGLVRAMSA